MTNAMHQDHALWLPNKTDSQMSTCTYFPHHRHQSEQMSLSKQTTAGHSITMTATSSHITVMVWMYLHMHLACVFLGLGPFPAGADSLSPIAVSFVLCIMRDIVLAQTTKDCFGLVLCIWYKVSSPQQHDR